MKKSIKIKVRKFSQNYLSACDFEEKEKSVDMLSGYISNNYELFDFTDEEIEFIEEEDLFSFIQSIMDEEVNSFMNTKFNYNENCLTGSYVGLDHISCDKDNYFDYEELEERCDPDKIYLFQLHNNSDLPPLVLFAVFNEGIVDEAINCAKENNCVSYQDGSFDDNFCNSFLKK
jgi:hypothetical protein